jgi:chromodomain-helicase-DNA-binding protein 1
MKLKKPKHVPDNVEFLIKWKDWSHLHNTWETFDYLKDFKGIKKVDNYMKKIIIPYLTDLQQDRFDADELEAHNIWREATLGEFEEFKKVERVISHRQVTKDEHCPTGIQYYCKWNKLPYNQCTWESENDIIDYQKQIDLYHKRIVSLKIPGRGHDPSNLRPIFQKLAEQPGYITGGQLRDYQLHGVNWMAYLWCKNRNGILADEMGLGKTVQTISFLSYLFNGQKVYGPFLVIVPLSTIGNWERELAKWAPELNSICYIGNAASRNTIREYEFYQKGTKKAKFNCLLTTYELVLKDKAFLSTIKWAFMAIDEGHRLKNQDSQLYSTLEQFRTLNRLLITGTPLQNNLKELRSLIRFLNPDEFGDDEVDEIDLSQEDQEHKIKAIHQRLEGYVLRRLKDTVEDSVPPKREIVLRVDLAAQQTRYYREILNKNYAALSAEGGGHAPSLQNITIELLKVCNHPYLFHFPDIDYRNTQEALRSLIYSSGKMILLDNLLTHMYKNGHRVLIFSQMVRYLDIIADYLQLKRLNFQRLDGSISSESRKNAIEHYNAPGSNDFVFLLSTRAGGLGINLTTADTVILMDTDWNPQNDLQAMARCHRIGQTKQVNVYRFVSKMTLEEKVFEHAKRKRVLGHCVIDKMDTSGTTFSTDGITKSSKPDLKADDLNRLLKFGAANMFQDNDNQRKLEQMNIDDILAHGEVQEFSENQEKAIEGGQEFLDQILVADFAGVAEPAWQDIIPVDQRIEVKSNPLILDDATTDSPRRRRNVNYREDDNGRDSASSSGRTKRKHQNVETEYQLTDKDIRGMCRGLLHFGNILSRRKFLQIEEKLTHIPSPLFENTLDELLKFCQDSVDKNMDQDPNKALLVTFEGVDAINAKPIVSRHYQLDYLNRVLEKFDLLNEELPIPVKSTSNWSCSWDKNDDAMLLLGIHRHGFGAWSKIGEDSELGLEGKFYLGGNQPSSVSPKPPHLVRRGEYLMGALIESEILNTDRNHKSISHQLQLSRSKSSKPKNKGSYSHQASPQSTHSASHRNGRSNGQPTMDQYVKRSRNRYEEDVPSYQECASHLKPAKKALRYLRDTAPDLALTEKVQAIKDCLYVIGSQIEKTLQTMPSRDKSRWKIGMWTAILQFWPDQWPKNDQDKEKQVSKIRSIYDKLSTSDFEPTYNSEIYPSSNSSRR